MSANQNDDPQASRSRLSLLGLRDTLAALRSNHEPERLHAALLEVVDGLITHAELQHRAIEDIRGDLMHKQGIVTHIGGGAFRTSAPGEALREFASSSNGDRWLLGRDAATGVAHVVHRANEPSGGAVTHIELGIFLNRGNGLPEQIDLLRLIGTLADEAVVR